MNLRKLFAPAAIIALLGTGAAAQTLSTAPQQSVAEAARKARAEKKESSKPVRVFTDDDVRNLKGTISVVGAAPPSDGAGKPATAAAPGQEKAQEKSAAEAEAKDEASWRKKFAGARKTLADDNKELDILQREYNLKQQQFYTDPNTALKQQNSREDLNKTLDQINTKKQDIEKDKQAIADLEDELRKSGGDAGWASEP
jgi:hypothetical protein